MAETVDFQALHERCNPDALPPGPPSVILVKLSLLRRLIVDTMIGLGVEPDEATISRIADASAPWTLLVNEGGDLKVRDVSEGRSTADLIRLQVEHGWTIPHPDHYAARHAAQTPEPEPHNGYMG